MRASAFCPAHVTGFFKASLDNGCESPEYCGSTGAGFSMRRGVTTHVDAHPRSGRKDASRITIRGYGADKTDVSERVLDYYIGMGGHDDTFFDIVHEIAVPVGFGLGSSAAVALSLSYALDGVLGTGLGGEEAARLAHNAEVACKTGLGDVLASYYGGFEIRTRPGAPGIGAVEKIGTEPVSILVACFSPVSTSKFIRHRLSEINGIGQTMVSKLQKTGDYDDFQDMSLEFARRVGVMTLRMEDMASRLADRGIKCGVALFGETVFSMVPLDREPEALEIMNGYADGQVIKSELDGLGARMLYN